MTDPPGSKPRWASAPSPLKYRFRPVDNSPVREDKLYKHWLEDDDPNRRWLARVCETLAKVSESSGSRRPDVCPDWHEYFCAIAEMVALRSKDKSRAVGAVIVQDGVIASTGYNGFPRGVREYEERSATEPTDDADLCAKYAFTTHAEENAVYNAARLGVSLLGATIYTTTFPCTKCAHAIVQAGIKRVFTYGTHWPNDPAGYHRAEEIFEEADVKVHKPTIRKLEFLAKLAGEHGDAVTATDPPGRKT